MVGDVRERGDDHLRRERRWPRVGRGLARAQHQQRLEERRHPYDALEVAQQPLDGADAQRVAAARRVRRAEDRAQRTDLDGVAQLAARRVGLEEADVARVAAGRREGGADARLLLRSARGDERQRVAVLVDADALDGVVGQDAARPTAAARSIAAAVGPLPLDHQHHAALAAHVAVGVGVKGAAALRLREHVRLNGQTRRNR